MPRVITCVVTGGEEEGKGEVRKRGGGGRGREGEGGGGEEVGGRGVHCYKKRVC